LSKTRKKDQRRGLLIRDVQAGGGGGGGWGSGKGGLPPRVEKLTEKRDRGIFLRTKPPSAKTEGARGGGRGGGEGKTFSQIPHKTTPKSFLAVVGSVGRRRGGRVWKPSEGGECSKYKSNSGEAGEEKKRREAPKARLSKKKDHAIADVPVDPEGDNKTTQLERDS